MKNNTPHWERKQDGRRQLQVREEKLSSFTKRILIVDDDPDITFTFKKAFEEANRIAGSNKICKWSTRHFIYITCVIGGLHLQLMSKWTEFGLVF